MPSVYVEMTADFLHPGHINILCEAGKYGDVIVGLLTDNAVASYRRIPLLSYEQRKKILENIKGISQIVPQESYDCIENIQKLKPAFVVHGNDWKTGFLSPVRKKVIEVLHEWNGKLIEPQFTEGVSATDLINKIRSRGTTPDNRRKRLKELLQIKPLVRILEVHNGLTGLIVERTKIDVEGKIKEFDGMWESSLTDSASKGKPDTGAVDITSRIQTIEQILEVTTKPMIVDADNGGLTEQFAFTVKTLERHGISAVIIEDKIGAKRNSLFGTDVKQEQDSIEEFSEKIKVGKNSQATEDFMIIARIESLILKKGLADALERAKAYINSGADGIMIHSKEKNGAEILDFCKEYNSFHNKVPLVVVPSTYSHIKEKELEDAGVNVIIYANHLIRSAYPAMIKTAESILKNERAHEVEEHCMSIKDILNLVPS
ncbi:MAG: phosphoenolpyruvate mutase [Nanoarchaeota archaeon]|nr:phosphoenolpyruvate mutase [Nanoarchaeota archaeon]